MHRNLLVCVIALLVTGFTTSGWASPKDEAAARYRQGKAYFEQGLYARAAGEYKAAYELLPKPALLFNIGRALHLAKDHAAAKTYYEKYIEADPGGEGVDEAREFIAEIEALIAEQKQARVRGHVRQAKVFRGKGLLAPAIDEYRSAYELSQEPEYLFEVGELYYQLHKKEAIPNYRQYLVARPTGPRSEQARARIAEILSKIEEHELTLARAQQETTAPTVHRRRWPWIVSGVAAIGLGVALDLAPNSARNGSFEALDIAPIGLYAGGLTLLGIGVF